MINCRAPEPLAQVRREETGATSQLGWFGLGFEAFGNSGGLTVGGIDDVMRDRRDMKEVNIGRTRSRGEGGIMAAQRRCNWDEAANRHSEAARRWRA